MRPSGHLQIYESGGRRQYVALWRDAAGKRHKKRLGKAWVKQYGTTDRGAPRWRAADGPKPEGNWLTPREAQDQLELLLADLVINPPPPPPKPTVSFEVAVDEWLRYVEYDRERAPTTVRDYRNTAYNQLVPHFGAERLVNTITTDDIDAYREQRLAEGRLARRTLQKHMVMLHAIFKRAKRRKWVEYNPAADAERITFKRSGDFNVLTPAQVDSVAAAASNELLSTVIVVAAYSGLRMGELRALRWRDVDFAKRSLFVRRNFTGGEERAPKSGKVRSVPLVDQALVVLDRLSQRGVNVAPDSIVFCDDWGQRLHEWTIRTAFYDALAAAGLGSLRTGDDPIVFHDLRHTFGTLAVQAFPLTDVKAYMGHEDVSTTMIYVHHVPRHDAADKLSALLRRETEVSLEAPVSVAPSTG